MALKGDITLDEHMQLGSFQFELAYRDLLVAYHDKTHVPETQGVSLAFEDIDCWMSLHDYSFTTPNEIGEKMRHAAYYGIKQIDLDKLSVFAACWLHTNKVSLHKVGIHISSPQTTT